VWVEVVERHRGQQDRAVRQDAVVVQRVRRVAGPTMYRDIAVITRAGTALSPPAQRFVARLRADFS